MEEIKIPKDLLDEFSGPGFAASENGSADPSDRTALLSLERSVAWLVDVADDFATERDYPGLGKMSNSDYAELTTIVLERSFGAEMMRHSPEFLWGLATAGIITSNLIAHSRKQKAEQDQKEKAKAENGEK